MVVFSTIFYVTKELTKEKLIELAFEWVNKSQHYEFDNLIWNGEDLYEQECSKQKFSMVQSNDKRILAIRLENVDNDNILWTNEYVYEEKEDNNIFMVRLAHDAIDKDTTVTRRYNRPRLMKKILELGYGAEDANLLISDKAILITDNNLDLAENIICGKTSYLLPIVYVTRCFSDNSTILDVEQLAKDLAGTAHVIVEESTDITTKLKEETDGKNPFNGAVHIYYTDKVGTRIIPDEFTSANNFRFKISNSVFKRLSLIRVEDKYTWGTIRYQKILEKYREDLQANSDLEKTCEEILKLKENEHKQLVEELETELNDLRSKLEYYEYAFQNNKKDQMGNMIFNCSETEFFEGEIKDMLLRLIQNEMKKMDEDPNQIGWRKYHVLKALSQENQIVGNGEKLSHELKEIFSRLDKINAKDKKRLRELGFVDRENKHNKLYFHNDDRYLITVGKTPSDSCAASNAATQAINTIVC